MDIWMYSYKVHTYGNILSLSPFFPSFSAIFFLHRRLFVLSRSRSAFEWLVYVNMQWLQNALLENPLAVSKDSCVAFQSMFATTEPTFIHSFVRQCSTISDQSRAQNNYLNQTQTIKQTKYCVKITNLFPLSLTLFLSPFFPLSQMYCSIYCHCDGGGCCWCSHFIYLTGQNHSARRVIII